MCECERFVCVCVKEKGQFVIVRCVLYEMSKESRPQSALHNHIVYRRYMHSMSNEQAMFLITFSEQYFFFSFFARYPSHDRAFRVYLFDFAYAQLAFAMCLFFSVVIIFVVVLFIFHVPLSYSDLICIENNIDLDDLWKIYERLNVQRHKFAVQNTCVWACEVIEFDEIMPFKQDKIERKMSE